MNKIGSATIALAVAVALVLASVQATQAGDRDFTVLQPNLTNVRHDPDGIWKDSELVPMAKGGQVGLYRAQLKTADGTYLLSTATIAGCSLTYCPVRLRFTPSDGGQPRIIVSVEAPLYGDPSLSADGKFIIIGSDKFPIK